MSVDSALLESTIYCHARKRARLEFGPNFNNVFLAGVLFFRFLGAWLDSTGLASDLVLVVSSGR